VFRVYTVNRPICSECGGLSRFGSHTEVTNQFRATRAGENGRFRLPICNFLGKEANMQPQVEVKVTIRVKPDGTVVVECEPPKEQKRIILVN
jgi:hypothetical protein